MSENRQGKSFDRSAPTEELEKLIAFTISEEEIDFGLLDELFDIYERRGGSGGVDVDAALGRFHRDYAGQEEMYSAGCADNTTQTAKRTRREHPRKRKRVLRSCYVASALVVALMVFLLATPVGAAFRNSAARWTSEIFGFGLPDGFSRVSGELRDLHDALGEHGITQKVAPTWVPDGFALLDVYVAPNVSWTIICAVLSDADRELVYQVAVPSESSSHIYEKDGSEISVYARNGVEHYIMSNMGKIQVVWAADNYECCLAGDISEDEAVMMIDSIYER